MVLLQGLLSNCAYFFFAWNRAFRWRKRVGRNDICSQQGISELHWVVLLNIGDGLLILDQGFSSSHPDDFPWYIFCFLPLWCGYNFMISSTYRFSEVAHLLCVCWLEITGKINTSMLAITSNIVHSTPCLQALRRSAW